jgi:hypothetical protein
MKGKNKIYRYFKYYSKESKFLGGFINMKEKVIGNKLKALFLLIPVFISVLLFGCASTPKIGTKGPAGGTIFYINPNASKDGWTYLEAAPVSSEWTSTQWGKRGTTIGGTSTDIGTGKKNTELIIAKLNASPSDKDSAAQLCNSLVLNGFSDWFLPSKDELNLMYTNLHKKGLGGFAKSDYLSSSEDSSSDAWGQDFSYGIQISNLKNISSRVRAIRAF